MIVELGIGGYALTNRLSDIIKTYSLGSCVAVVVYEPTNRVLGMAHVALPDSKLNPELAKTKPGYFADTAVNLLLDKAICEFCCQEFCLEVRLYGGSESCRKTDVFKIGQRNLEALERACADRKILCYKADTGGRLSRSVEADVATGAVKIYKYPLVF